MNNQFATQFLLEELDEFESLRSMLSQMGASEDSIEMLVNAVAKGHIEPSKAVEIVKATAMHEDGAAAAAPAGGSTTGGGVTNGASFTPGTGEQYAAGTKKVRKSLGEDAPMLAGGKKANISTYTNDGFTKAPSAKEAGKHIKGVEVKELWEGSVPDNIAKFAKRKGISSMVNKIAGWAEKAGKQITGGTAVGRNYDTLVLDLGHQDSAIRVNIDEKTITVYGQPVRDYNSFVAALKQKDDSLNENYYKFRNETKTRGKSEQFHEAVKTITKKLDEVNRLLEFTGTLKTELSEGEDAFEVKHNTKKAMDKVRGKVVEAYKKLKQL